MIEYKKDDQQDVLFKGTRGNDKSITNNEEKKKDSGNVKKKSDGKNEIKYV